MNVTSQTPSREDSLSGFQPDPASPHPEPVQQALFVARRLQERASTLQTAAERRQQAELDRLLQNPEDKVTLVQMTDQAFRSRSAHRIADQFIHILDVQGIPRFFSPLQRTLLRGFQTFGGYAPGVAVPLVRDRMQQETANVILPGEREMLAPFLVRRREQGIRMNVNYLGEAILGEAEAERRLQAYLQALQWPEIEVVSVKISTLYSRISPLARGHTIATLCDRLELLYREAARMRFTRTDGSQVPKFVYLDMEEYRDMSLTAEVFMRTLDRKGLEQARAGIALQTYVPDSFATQQRINDWARNRVARGGAPVTLRIVKGANLEMERVEASVKGWPQAPFKTKLGTDANYKRMLHEGMKPENLAAVRLGVASHNLFDLAYGYALASAAGKLDAVQFEMLEGMANHQRRALFELARNILLYAPACRKEDFIHAIGYLIRRLDENTGPDNFLRHAFKLEVDGGDWRRLEQAFLDSFQLLPRLQDTPRRTQDRRLPPPHVHPVARGWQEFVNEPDTDFSLPHHSEWADGIVARWKPRCDANASMIPLVIAGVEENPKVRSSALRECRDPSRPGVVVGRYREASEADADRAVECARRDPDGWRTMDEHERFEILGNVARKIRRTRADLIGAAMAQGGKTILESDPEVSEAVDFVEFYRDTARGWRERPALRARPKGVVVVVPPWNFPIAIPCGGVAAALAAGNMVILKPASDAVLVAWELCRCFWRAGVSKTALQFVPGSGSGAGRRLVSNDLVDAVILTGGTATALAMLRERPEMNLCAETGGKNATIVTALSDRDQAIKHVLHSAFSHGGQKCSATSLLLLEAEVYDDPNFKRALCDAVESLPVGSAWDLENTMGPLIRPPSGDLENALKVLEPGEEWAVMPRNLAGNPHLWSPGVKWGVQPGSDTHTTEFFGPVLGVMRFGKLPEAVEYVNQTGYGLTSGLESLDDREQSFWREHIEAGNLYINRPTTGAVVLRQPFGGFGKSSVGPGIKVGSPNYVTQFMDFEDRDAPGERPAETVANPNVAELMDRLLGAGEAAVETREGLSFGEWVERLAQAVAGQERSLDEEFGRTHDHFLLIGQDNLRRYRVISPIHVRLHPDDGPFELFARVCAARIAGCRVALSVSPGVHPEWVKLLERVTESWAGWIEVVEETDEELAESIRAGRIGRVRYAAPDRVSAVVRRAAAETGSWIACAPVLREGRLELLNYIREQSVSADYHRYGNLGDRLLEERSDTL